MSMRPSPIEPVPEETARIARAAFCKGNLLMRIRDEIGVLYDDQMFTSLYDARGQLATAPWRLALITVFQFLENLSDRQAAEAVRGRIDLKYALSLDLEDAGFDFSVLCEFRARLLAGEHDQNLLEVMLEHLGERGLVKARGKQRTDSTHVLAAIRTLNHLELVGETMRAALNAVATSAPQWLIEHNRPAWAERYGARVEQYRLPKGEARLWARRWAPMAMTCWPPCSPKRNGSGCAGCPRSRGCGSSGSNNFIMTRAGCAGVCQSTSQPTPPLTL